MKLQPFVTKTGCAVSVVPLPALGRGTAALVLRMADPHDGRTAEVALTREERYWLAARLLAFDIEEYDLAEGSTT